MSIRRFRRHSPPCLDAAIHRIFDSLITRHALRGAFTRLLTVARARSDLLRDAAPPRGGRYPQLEALRNLAGHHRDFTGDPWTWPGAPGHHPLGIIDSLARHVLGRYPTPRFLASVWFGGDDDELRARRGWYIEHTRGRRFRDLRLPLVMTRRMEHAFLRSPDHLGIDRALRRAEVLGLGGSPALADAVIASRIGARFDRPELWRDVLRWLVACGDEVDLAWVARIIELIHGAIEPPRLTGRPFEVVRRELEARAAPPPLPPRRGKTWLPAAWPGASFLEGAVAWRLRELTSSIELVLEGRALRHCVATYTGRCVRGSSQIWSLRRAISGGREESVLTIEVSPFSATIVQIRGRRNERPSGPPLALVQRWAARERLRFAPGTVPEPPPPAC